MMNQPRYSIDQKHLGKVIKVGRRTTKQKLDLRIKKHMSTSQLPIDSYQEMKQNNSLNSILAQRPYSSLLSYQNQIDKKKKKHISIESIKNERESVVSRQGRRKSKNSLSFDQQSVFKNKLGDCRKKYNLSCNDMLQEKQIKTNKKNMKAPKRHSINVLGINVPNFPLKTKKDNGDKSKSKIKKNNEKIQIQGKLSKKIMPTTHLNKEKEKNPFRKKSQTVLIPNPSQPLKKNVKNTKKAKPKKVVIGNNNSSEQDYPINKYVPIIGIKKIDNNSHKKSTNNKPQKQFKQKNMVQFSSCLNIMSASSGLIKSSQISFRSGQNQRIQGRSQQNYLQKSELNIQDSQSLNLSEIRYYQNNSPQTYRNNQAIFNFNKKSINKKRSRIGEQIRQKYPGLNKDQINFLASVIFIQRKWKQNFVSKKIDKFKITNKTEEDKSFLLLMKQTRIHSITIGESKNSQILPRQEQQKEQQNSLIRQEFRQQSSKETQQLKNLKKKANPICQIGIQVSQISSARQKYIENQDQQQDTIKKDEYFVKPVLTQRTPHFEENDHRKMQYYFENEVFPPLSFFQIQQALTKKTMQKKLNQLNLMFNSRLINKRNYLERKESLQIEYTKEMNNLKNSRKSIKKGFLRYIECLQKNKSIQRSGLRKVSSQSGFMSNIYQKFYKFQKAFVTQSDSSESIRSLTRRVLIRREFFDVMKSNQRRNRYKDQEMSISNLYNSSLYSEKLEPKNGTGLNQEIGELSEFKQFRDSSQMINISDFLQKSKKQHGLDDIEPTIQEQVYVEKIVNRKRSTQNYENVIISYLLDKLTQQLHADLSQFNTISIEEVSLDSSESDYSIKDKPKNMDLKLHQRLQNQNTFIPKSSPVGSQRQSLINGSNQEIKKYIQAMIKFLIGNGHLQNMVQVMNSDSGISALSYLKFLRDFELPSDQYRPILRNQIFIQWQSQYFDELKVQFSPQIIQSQSEFHRCIFQAFVTELEKKKKYGQKGKPFPWDTKAIPAIPITIQSLANIFQECMNSVLKNCSYVCGIIQGKYTYFTQDELEKIHEDNEDRIISMLQDQFMSSYNIWYEIDQSKLQFKLQICEIVQEILFKEIIKDITKIQFIH